MNRISREGAIDLRYKSFNHLKKDNDEYQWEIEIPNTEVSVKVVLGDAESTNQINQIYVENTLIDDPDGEDNFDEIVVSGINITDGKLTIKPGPQAVDAKICYINIYYKELEPVFNKIYLKDESIDLSIFPIPASDYVNISFIQNQTGNMTIEIFNTLGRHVETITSGIREAGRQEIIFSTSHLTPSVYFLKCTVNGYRLTRKIIIQ